MTIFTDTNHGRVDKIIDFVNLIKKSAASNKATSADTWELLSPAMEAIAELVGAEAKQPTQEAPAAAETRTSADKRPEWYKLHQMAHDAPLKELNRVVAIYVNRVDEELS